MTPHRRPTAGVVNSRFLLAWITIAVTAVWCPGAHAADHGHGSAAKKLEGMVVTAERIEAYVRENPMQTAVIDGDEIEERNLRGVSEALGTLPGVEVIESGAGIGARISIRGSGRGPVLILIDGRPLNASQFGTVNLNAIPIDTVERIVVFKPPVPVWLGPGAAAGAVNIVTRTTDTAGAKRKPAKRRLKISGGSYGAAEIGYTHNQPLADGGLMLSAGAGHVDRKRPNADRDHLRTSLHWDRQGENLVRYQANGRFYYSANGVSGPTYKPTPDARQRYGKGSLDVQADGFTGETGEYSLKAYGDLERLEDTSQTGFESTLDQYKLGVKGDHTWSGGDGASVRIGGLTERDHVNHTLTGSHHREKASLHTQIDRRFGSVTATAGARGDWTSDFDLSPAVQGGLSVPLSDAFLLKANAGYTETVPSFSQLYQPSHGAIDHVTGNPDLTPEKVFSWDLGLTYERGGHLDAQLVFFREDYRDKIVYQKDDDLVSTPDNIPRTWRHGFEVSLKWAFSDDASLDLSYVVQDSEEKESGNRLTYAPTHRLKITPRLRLRTGTRVEVAFRLVSEQYSDLENSDFGKLDGYVAVDLKLTQPLTIGGLAVDLFADINNLTDTAFESHDGYPDDGFRVVSGVNVNF